jgi:hypothetical protein
MRIGSLLKCGSSSGSWPSSEWCESAITGPHILHGCIWASMPPLWESSVSLAPFGASKAPEFVDFNADLDPAFLCGQIRLFQNNPFGSGSATLATGTSLQVLCFHFNNWILALGIWSWTTSCWILRVTSRLRTLACAKRYRTPSFHDYFVKPKSAASFVFFRRALISVLVP